MLYAIILNDAEGSDDLRKQHHAGHIAHFGAHKASIALAGPLSDDDGASVGSLVVFEAASEAEARRFIEGDPFHGAGVWQGITVTRFKASIVDTTKLT